MGNHSDRKEINLKWLKIWLGVKTAEELYSIVNGTNNRPKISQDPISVFKSHWSMVRGRGGKYV